GLDDVAGGVVPNVLPLGGSISFPHERATEDQRMDCMWPSILRTVPIPLLGGVFLGDRDSCRSKEIELLQSIPLGVECLLVVEGERGIGTSSGPLADQGGGQGISTLSHLDCRSPEE